MIYCLMYIRLPNCGGNLHRKEWSIPENRIFVSLLLAIIEKSCEGHDAF